MDQRFTSKVIKGKNNCWEWIAAKNQGGYGMYNYNGKGIPAHRAVFLMVHGDIKHGYEIDHLCNNPSCVNPLHLNEISREQHIVITNLRKSNKCRI